MNTNRRQAGGLLTIPDGPRSFFDEAVFTRSIALERKRAERSGRLLLLMLLDMSGLAEPGLRADEKVQKALGTSIRETDVLGWYKSGSVLGIIFTEIPKEVRCSIVSTMLTRINGILYSALMFEEFSKISITHYLFPEEWSHDVPERPSEPTLYPDVAERESEHRRFALSKRIIDVIGASIGLLLALPLLLVIAFAIKISSKGPVLFRQVRVGQYGAPFVFLKFRSMFAGNDARIHREYVKALISRSPTGEKPGCGAGVYKLTRDPRVTKIGVFLRKTSLDELPQLYNVLKGEMSLVGPRPAIPYEVDAYQPWHRRRVLEAKPGITGLWQVKGRSRVSFDEMVRLDVRYAMAQSLRLDLEILMHTPRAVLWAEGAY